MRVFVVAGSPEGVPPLGLAPGLGDLVIAADRGAAHALSWGWPLDLLVGDLDSLPAETGARLGAAGLPTITAPAAKDETDLELALGQALKTGAQEIVICAALGGRSDHWLANVLLLAAPALAGRRVSIAQGAETIHLLRGAGERGEAAGELCVHGEPGDLLSLVPVGGDAVGVTTSGLLYPLHDETLLFGGGRGVSNVFETEKARVRLRSGALLVIHTVQRHGV